MPEKIKPPSIYTKSLHACALERICPLIEVTSFAETVSGKVYTRQIHLLHVRACVAVSPCMHRRRPTVLNAYSCLSGEMDHSAIRCFFFFFIAMLYSEIIKIKQRYAVILCWNSD